MPNLVDWAFKMARAILIIRDNFLGCSLRRIYSVILYLENINCITSTCKHLIPKMEDVKISMDHNSQNFLRQIRKIFLTLGLEIKS